MTDNLPPDLLAQVRAEFDAEFYLASNKDVAEAGVDPFAHFMVFGAREKRDPRHDFSLGRYLDLHADVREAGANPFVHWVIHGRSEGRATDHGLGFRYEILSSHKPIEERLRDLRLAIPDRPADDIAALTRQLTCVPKPAAVHVTVSHDDYTCGVGGVQFCLRLESEAMRSSGAIHLHLFPYAANAVIDVERDAPTVGVLINDDLIGFFRHSDLVEHLGPWLTGRSTTLAIHSLIGHAVPNLLEVLHAAELSKGYFWLHDFSSLCAGYTLMRDDVAFCGGPPMESNACEICSYGRRRRIQLAAHAEVFSALDLTVVAPSPSALALWKSRFPVSPFATVVHAHARLEPQAMEPLAAREEDRPLRVAFLGMPAAHKGWPVFADLAIRYADDPRYDFHHLSAVQQHRAPAAYTHVAPSEADPQPMPAAIEALEIDVVVLWSLWPETFCLAALEALAAGAVLVTNPSAGNVVDIVRQTPSCGRVLPDEEALFDLFASGEILALAPARRPRRQSMRFSRLSADLILETTA